ncbi:MAG TPA: PadR family transcriptional regulator [Actinomycetota bacterium]|nr:PadR family transcriptional regulator [Actinomycetota bacterium]
MAPELNSTAYALLGHIALRPWSAYELTRSLRRSLHWFWPRAESRIYDEARKLVEAGLAIATTERSGARNRTTYAATDAGRAALASWLATEATTFAYHSEALLRVHLAGFGTKDQLLRAVEGVDATAAAILADAREVATMYAEGRHPLQGDAPVRALVVDHLVSLATALQAWARRTRHEVDFWDGLEADERKQREAIRRMTRAVQHLPARPTDDATS